MLVREPICAAFFLEKSKGKSAWYLLPKQLGKAVRGLLQAAGR